MTGSNNKELEKAISERDAYIKEHPHMQGFQDEIDSRLANETDATKRCVIILKMLAERQTAFIDNIGKFFEYESKDK